MRQVTSPLRYKSGDRITMGRAQEQRIALPYSSTPAHIKGFLRGKNFFGRQLNAAKLRERREMPGVRDATVLYLKRIGVGDRERAGDIGRPKRCEQRL